MEKENGEGSPYWNPRREFKVQDFKDLPQNVEKKMARGPPTRTFVGNQKKLVQDFKDLPQNVKKKMARDPSTRTFAGNHKNLVQDFKDLP